jgi:hypothetical protein
MKSATPVVKIPRWDAVFLVCADCRERSNGPKLKTKALANLVRHEARRSKTRTRILLTGCLGLCPKAATAVAHVSGDAGLRIVAIRSKKQVAEAVALLRATDR